MKAANAENFVVGPSSMADNIMIKSEPGVSVIDPITLFNCGNCF